MSKKKVCMITFEYPPNEGGIGVSVRRISNYLKEDYEVHIFTVGTKKDNYIANSKKTVESSVEDGVHVHRYNPYFGTLTKVPPQEIQHMMYFLRKLHREIGFDIFHGFRVHAAGFMAVMLAREFNVKSLVSVRGNDIGREIYNSSLFSQTFWTLEKCDRISFVAKEQFDVVNLIDDFSLKGKVILNSVNPKEFYFKDLSNEEFVPKLHGKVIGFCGLARLKKGIVYLLEAFAKYNSEAESTLFIVGDFMPEEKEFYHSKIRELGLENEVVVTGRVPHKLVLNYIDLMDVFVLPSIEEGCPNALLESMFCGKSVIGANVGAVPEIIQDGKNGLVIEPYSVNEIYGALRELDDEGESKVFERNAKKTIESSFGPAREKDDWLDMYRSLL